MRRFWLTVGLSVSLCALGTTAVPVLAAECPNEQLRAEDHSTSLPDCRSYEMVTPPSKNGEYPGTSPSYISQSGTSFQYSSLGAFGEPGNDLGEFGVEYLSSRNASGWTSTPITASAENFQKTNVEPLDYNPDLTQALALEAPIGETELNQRLYIQNLASGSFDEIGPLLSPEAIAGWTPEDAEQHNFQDQFGYVGASEGFAHVLFHLHGGHVLGSTAGWRWPGDHTLGTGDSLYEYSGLGSSEPELVGVSNGESLAAAAAKNDEPHIDEAAKQISECGVYLGGVPSQATPETRDAYNAIADGGETIFFTAQEGGCTSSENENGIETVGAGPPAQEVYARIDSDRTVDISEPTDGPAGECSRCNETKPLFAVFQGANREGTKAFFITEQELLPGAKGESLYEYDFDGPEHEKVSLVATDLTPDEGETGGVVRVTENGVLVYFVSEDVLAANPDPKGQDARAGDAEEPAYNLYVYNTDTHATAFVAPLAVADRNDWSASDSRPVEATPDGRFLLFPSTAALTPGTSGASRQLYRYEAPTEVEPDGVLTRVSIGAAGSYECPSTKKIEAGYNCDGQSEVPGFSVFSPRYTKQSASEVARREYMASVAVAITSDGSTVFFQSPLALTPGALNDVCAWEEEGECRGAEQNVYEWAGGHVSLISDGRDTHSLFRSSATKLIGATPDGSDVYFTTADQLVAQDSDTQVDVYDARVDGGLPGLVSSSGCAQECQGLGTAAPVLAAPGSTTFSGAGNLAPAPTPSARAKSPMASRAEKLARALDACKRDRLKRTRVVCERRARKKYGPAHPAKKAKQANREIGL